MDKETLLMPIRNRRLVLYGALLVFLMAQLAALVTMGVERASPSGIPPIPYVPTSTLVPTTVEVVLPDAAVETAYACLRWETSQIHLSKGLVLSSPEHNGRYVPYESALSTSPDGRYALRLVEDQVLVSDGEDVILTVLEDVRAVSPSVPLQVSWSPDSHHIGLVKGRLLMLVAIAQRKVEKIEIRDVYLRATGWSADSAYFAAFDFERLLVWSAENGRLEEVPTPPETRIAGARWSPVNHQLVYQLEPEADSRPFFSLYNPDADTQRRFPGLASRVNAFHWSPDGRYLAIEQEIPGGTFRDLVTLIIDSDGGIVTRFDLTQVAVIYPMGIDPSHYAVWSPSADEIYWLATNEADQVRLMVHDLETDRTAVLTGDLDMWQFNDPYYTHFAFAEEAETERSLQVMNLASGEKVSLVADADDLGRPTWSPDGRHVAAVWATGQGGGREVYLSWMQADGQGHQRLDDHFWDVRDVRWLADDDALAYVARRRDGYRVEVVGLLTGRVRVIAGPMDTISGLSFDDSVMSFLWAHGDEKGISAFHADGTPAYALKLAVETDLAARMNIFWSPDHRLAAIKAGPYRNEVLQLATADGAWNRVIRSGLYGLGNPLWSPDGKLLTFTQAPAWGQLSLDVVTAAGGDLWREAVFPWNLAWAKCGQEP